MKSPVLVNQESSRVNRSGQSKTMPDALDFGSMTITDRMQQLLVRRGIRPKDVKPALARACGVTKQAVWRWFNGDTGAIKSVHIIEIAKQFSTTTDWLLTGNGPMDSQRSAIEKKNSSLQIKQPNFVTIELFDYAGSLELDTSLDSDYAEVMQSWTVSKYWLDRLNVNYTSTSNLAVIMEDADAMKGSFNKGDTLLVDRGITEFKSDGVYIFRFKENVYTRRLQLLPDGELLVIPDNSKYRSYSICIESKQDFHVLARVLLAWKSKKM